MTTEELVKEHLSREGYKYDIDEDGDIHFKYEGTHLYYIVDNDDPLFFRITMPNIYTIDNDRTKVLEAISEINAEKKVLKAFLVRESVWLSVELLIDTTPDLDDFFQRCLDILMGGRSAFSSKI